MTTLKLLEDNHSKLLDKYRLNKHSFPLIVSVLKGIQPGLIYTDAQHENYFIIHKSGFADLIETRESVSFDLSLYDFLLYKKFLNEKIRWYDVPIKWINKFRREKNENFALVERAQLVRKSCESINYQNNDGSFYLKEINSSNYDAIEKNFGFSPGERFWASKHQFLNSSFGIMCYKNDCLVALCYACALVDAIAEVDVFTHSEYRARGLGKLCVANFINMCIERNIKAHWDCYMNNKPSFALAKIFGFDHYNSYVHAIISK